MAASLDRGNPQCDVVIRNGQVFDGAGAPAVTADVAIHEGKVQTIGHRLPQTGAREIDAQGHYTLLTRARKGAAPGWYKVAVTAGDRDNPNNPYITHWLVPQKYIDARTSNLAFEVVEKPEPGAYDLKLDAK